MKEKYLQRNTHTHSMVDAFCGVYLCIVYACTRRQYSSSVVYCSLHQFLPDMYLLGWRSIFVILRGQYKGWKNQNTSALLWRVKEQWHFSFRKSRQIQIHRAICQSSWLYVQLYIICIDRLYLYVHVCMNEMIYTFPTYSSSLELLCDTLSTKENGVCSAPPPSLLL